MSAIVAHASSDGMKSSMTQEANNNTQPLERQTLATQIHALLNKKAEGIGGSRRQTYGQFLLDLEQNTLDDEAYLPAYLP